MTTPTKKAGHSRRNGGAKKKEIKCAKDAWENRLAKVFLSAFDPSQNVPIGPNFNSKETLDALKDLRKVTFEVLDLCLLNAIDVGRELERRKDQNIIVSEIIRKEMRRRQWMQKEMKEMQKQSPQNTPRTGD